MNAYEARAAWLRSHGNARGVFAYICAECHHRSHDHLLDEDGDLREGPYLCADCDCIVTQATPVVGLTERFTREWDALLASRDSEASQ